jgi:competence protein ComEC
VIDWYWGSGSPIWNNGGDTIIVRTPDGTIVVENGY